MKNKQYFNPLFYLGIFIGLIFAFCAFLFDGIGNGITAVERKYNQIFPD